MDCPVDLSALALFSPPFSDNNDLIRAVPCYKTVASMHLWDPSSFDAVFISSPWALLGLPFLTRKPAFSKSTKVGYFFSSPFCLVFNVFITATNLSISVEFNLLYIYVNKSIKVYVRVD